MGKRALLLLLAGMALGPSARAADDDKRACLSSYESAQRLRHRGSLVAASQALAVCARASCPEVLRQDCVAWRGEVDRALPSVLFVATSPAGGDLADVRVTVDGAPFLDKIDAQAHTLEPGRHVIRFELAGAPSQDTEVVLAEGDGRRRVAVTMAPASSTVASAASAPEDPADAEGTPSGPRAVTLVSLGLGVVGLAALVTGAFFEVQALGEKSDLDACRPTCTTDQVDATRRAFVTGDALLIGGGASMAAGLFTYLFWPRSSTALRVDPTRTGARLMLEGFF